MRHFVHSCELSGYDDDDQKLRLLPACLVGIAHEMLTEILTHTPDMNFSDAVEALHVRLESPQQALMHEASLRQRVKLASETQHGYATVHVATCFSETTT